METKINSLGILETKFVTNERSLELNTQKVFIIQLRTYYHERYIFIKIKTIENPKSNQWGKDHIVLNVHQINIYIILCIKCILMYNNVHYIIYL